MAISGPMLLTVAEAASYLRTSEAAIYKMVERHQVPGVVRVGRRLLFHHQTLVHWLSQNATLSPKGAR